MEPPQLFGDLPRHVHPPDSPVLWQFDPAAIVHSAPHFAADALEKTGRRTFAEDIRQQIAAFNPAPPAAAAPESRIVQRVGTAFVVRPDGFLLTALHVVKEAQEIHVSCPETGTASAVLDKFSEANDLAVLRVFDRRTPTYLSLADPKTASLGQQVFTVGYPAPNILGSEVKFRDGVISSLSVGGDAGYMQISDRRT